MEIEIDIDEDDDLKEKNKFLKKIIELKTKKMTSVEFLKCIYNTFIESDKNEIYNDYKIEKIENYNVIKCINDNVKDEYSRYSLLGVKPSVAVLINQYIEKKMSIINNVFLFEGSPFINDEGTEYQYILKFTKYQTKENNESLIKILSFKYFC